MTGNSDSDNSPNETERDIAWYAAALDESAASDSRYSMAVSIRTKLGYGLVDDVSRDAPDEAKATFWAIDYHLEISEDGKRLVELVPRHNLNGAPEPPPAADVPERIKSLWGELLKLVQTPPAQARLAHLLFECGGPERNANGGKAVDAYIASADSWTSRDLDAVDDLRVATRLARAIADEAKATFSLERVLDLVEQLLEADDPLAGPILRGLTHAANEPLSPPRLDTILEKAATRLRDVDLRDQALVLIQQRCSDDLCRQKVWERRVKAYIDTSNLADEPLLRMANLHDALRLAEQSGIRELRECAAAQLQEIRDHDLGLIRFESSSALYEEYFEKVRESFISGDSWQDALIAFAHSGPLNGDVATNRELVAQTRTNNPMVALMPIKLLGPDQMPILTAESDEERFEYDLVRWEAQHVAGNARPLTAGLHMIVAKFGLPTTGELAQFLATWPGITQRALTAIVRAMYRFWTSDHEAAIYTLTPHIEALVRDLILRTSRGIYKLQQAHKPGQFPGLGAMLAVLSEEFEITESRLRFLKVLLTEPAGFNIRNNLSHGTDDYGDPGTAALLIHAALFLATLRPNATIEEVGEDRGSS